MRQTMSDLIERDKVIEYCLKLIDVERKQGSDVMNYGQERINQTDTIIAFVENLPSARPQGEWIPCSERLPKIGERVLLATNCGTVVIGHRDKPDLIWQVTEKGDKHWVYDPEAYTDDVDSLPKGEDCAFSQDTDYGDGFLSVTSLNYNPRFEGVIAWMPLPEPWKGADDE